MKLHMRTGGVLLGLCLAAGIGAQPRHFQQPATSDANMSVLIDAIEGFEVVDGAELACVTPTGYVAGLEILRGDPSWGLAVMGRSVNPIDTSDVIADGFRRGEPLVFLYWDPVTEWELQASVEADSGRNLTYRTNDILVIRLITLGVDDDVTPVPVGFTLDAPHPNPFNNGASVSYRLAQPGWVRLNLWDVRGVRVRELDSGVRGAGEYRASIGGDGLESGVYFIRIETPSGSASQRVVLLK